MAWKPRTITFKHKRRGRDRRRHAAARGYDYQWQQFREAYLRENMWCVDCMRGGRYTGAHHVHHIAKLRERPDLKYKAENLMALCERCHNERTARGE